MKFVLIATLVGALIGGGVYLGKKGLGESKTEDETTTTQTVERGPLRVVAAATGRVVSNLDVEIKAKSSGEIIKLPVDVADFVHKGDLLIELDPVDEKRRLEQNEAAVAAARARLQAAQANLTAAQRQADTGVTSANAEVRAAKARAAEAQAKAKRTKELYDQQLISRQDYEADRSAAIQASADAASVATRVEAAKAEKQGVEAQRQDVLAAKAQLESSQVDLRLQQQRIEDTVIVAPMDGVVTARTVQIGQIISSAISNVGGGTSALVLSDLSRLFVLAAVDESDIGNVAVGQEAQITADAFPGKRFRGKVERIASRGVNNQNVVTFEVKIEVLGRDKSVLKPEMTANVEIVTAEKTDALLVPSEAVTRKGRDRIVTVVKGTTNEERVVTTGITDGQQLEILSGLEEGESVLVRKGEAESRWRSNGQRGGMSGARMMMGGGRGRRP